MASLHLLRHIPIHSLRGLTPPVLKISTDRDVEKWKETRGYHDYALFLRRLNESVVGHYLPAQGEPSSDAIRSTLDMLDTLDRWFDEIPPLESPQRFGNLAFRTWGERLEERLNTILTTLLPPPLHPSIPFISPYLQTSFGSFTRMDYGTGHETSFALFLCCLSLIRFYNSDSELEERDLVLRVFVRYMRLCWRLQDVYRLEPAGSHGVWGLDDYSFISYIWGSGQLRDQTAIPPSSILPTISPPKPLPPTNLYNLSISRIHEVKTGPFHEHSSQLHSIAVGVQGGWKKVNSGLLKMYDAEVLGKRVVVQHLWLGGLIEWDEETTAATETATQTPVPVTSTSTAAPWASTTMTPAPWSRIATSAPFHTHTRTTSPNRGHRNMGPPAS